jgi:hypothetical protein
VQLTDAQVGDDRHLSERPLSMVETAKVDKGPPASFLDVGLRPGVHGNPDGDGPVRLQRLPPRVLPPG